MTLIDGARELAQSLMPNIPIRLGHPRYIDKMSDELLSPEYSTTIGLLLSMKLDIILNMTREN